LISSGPSLSAGNRKERVEFIVYPDAPHAFFADYRPGYRAEAAADAWIRCLSWFNRYLKE